MVADHRSESCLRAKYWDEGKSQAEIADELGVSRVTVFRWMKKHNIETRSKSEAESEGNVERLKDEEWLREQYKNKQKSQVEIAEELGVDSTTVGNWMDKHNIETRSNSEIHSEGDIGKLKNEEWVREQYENQQKTTYEIADKLGVSSSAVSSWIKKHGIETRSNSGSRSDGDIEKLKDEEWLREQYKHQEKSQAEIADELDVSDTAVGTWMDKHGIEARSYSESQSDGDVEKLKDEEWLREQYINQEKSTYKIAVELEVDNSSVRRWMNKHSIEARSNSESHAEGDIRKLKDEEWLREQYINQERSTVDIADELEVDSSSVRRWMNRHGVEMRSNSESHAEGDIEKLKDEEWLREQYKHQQKSTYEIADELNVGNSTICRWLKRHEISTRSSIIDPERTTHIVRSEWELEVCNILIETGVDYDYESIEIEYCDGSTYVPDFVTDEYVIEVKGAYFSEIHDHENTEREKALATMESLDKREYVVVGEELPADIHIPWEERSRIRELLSMHKV